MPNSRPLVFVHGYSDSGRAWQTWLDILARRLSTDVRDLRTVTYVSLNNEITIKDIGEGFDRALITQGILQDFDAVVHSTGMQVVRSWLRTDPRRIARLKRLIAFAPATFGSPLAKQGRSWLGAIFKGSKTLGPDFLNAGDIILDQLEPASVFGWELAESDILTDPARYSDGPDTPYVFVFCGTGNYSGIRELADKPGTDGTVRRAGCGMRIRKIEVDLTEPGLIVRSRRGVLAASTPITARDRILADSWLHTNIPVHLIGPSGNHHEAPNHATILSDPPPELQELVVAALVRTADPNTAEQGYKEWLKEADASGRISQMQNKFQQFIVHAVDERGDPINDYNFQLYRVDDRGEGECLTQFTDEVDVYGRDRSFRCFHVDVAGLLPRAGEPAPGLSFRIIANSGTPYVGYIGYGAEEQIDAHQKTDSSAWDAELKFTGEALGQIDFFQPYTTTLVRLYLERQVLPPDRSLPCELVKWDPSVGPPLSELVRLPKNVGLKGPGEAIA